MDQLKECRKLSAGQVFKSGRAVLGPEVLSIALTKKREREAEERRKQAKSAAVSNKRKAAYREACDATSREPDPLKWTMSHLRALISYKKQKTDEWALPKTKQLLIEKWLEVKGRITPPPTPIREILQDTQNEIDEQSEASNIIVLAQIAV
jgi:hypothetical protein